MRAAAISCSGEAEIGEADDLALVHGDAAEDLGEIFAEPDLRQQRLGLAVAPLGLHAAGVAGHFADRLDIGREPGEPVRGMLLALELFRAEGVAVAHARA